MMRYDDEDVVDGEAYVAAAASSAPASSTLNRSHRIPQDELFHHLAALFLLSSSLSLETYTRWAPFIVVCKQAKALQMCGAKVVMPA